MAVISSSLNRYLRPRLYTSLIKRVLKRKQKRSGNDTLRYLRPNALIQPTPSFFPYHPLQALYHAILWPVLARYMHAAFNCDVRVCYGSGHELSDSTQDKSVSRSHSPPLS